uniref:Uncharacterized protein n=1 Tax=Aegilops tauschii subsp. strangulata TaxID=200361 RepID=A0A453RFE8_AEGTS
MECNSSDVQMSHCAEGSETTIETKIKTLDSQTYNLHVNKCIRSSNQGEVGVCKYTVGGYIWMLESCGIIKPDTPEVMALSYSAVSRHWTGLIQQLCHQYIT